MSNVLFITHGGGPWPTLSFPGMDETDRAAMLSHFKSIDTLLESPKALIVVSAHWETEVISVNTHPTPNLYFDYHGFPEEAYHFSWPAKNDLPLAKTVLNTIQQAGIPATKNDTRGFDHGVYIPLMTAYPHANIPIVEVSIQNQLDPEFHLNLGKALRPLLTNDIALVTTGNSYHNIPTMFRSTPAAITAATHFDQWVIQSAALPEQPRWEALCNWKSAPYATLCHPREDHLIPLMVAAGAVGATPLAPVWQGTLNKIPLTSLGN